MRLFFFAVIFFLFFAACSNAQNNSGKLYQTSPDILTKDIYYHIEYLTSDSLEGRRSGNIGEIRAGNFIQNSFEKLGLRPFDDNYFQDFSFRYTSSSRILWKLNFSKFSSTNASDFNIIARTDYSQVFGRALFVGHGYQYEQDGLKVDDYEGVNFSNRWILLFDEEQGSLKGTKQDLIERLKISLKTDAIGVLCIDDADDLSGQPILVDPLREVPDKKRVVRISSKVADSLFHAAGLTAKEALKKKEIEKKPVNIPVRINLEGHYRVDTAYSRNVVAYLEGSDPGLKDEYIVVGAHYDHLGMTEESIFYGADDNASGTAGLLELSEKLVSVSSDLKRSIIFIAFGAEEQGLVGSEYFCEHLPVPSEKIKLMINLDMIGRMNSSNKVTAHTMEKNTPVEASLKEIIAGNDNLNMIFDYGKVNNSDHYPFYQKQIPVVFFTTGLHGEYHRPSDTIDKINLDGTKQILDVIYELIRINAEDI